MTTYVLVHGAWGGAHGFRHVRRLLHAAGHEVFTPSLTGIGERSHLTGPQVGLSTHVRDVVNTVLYEDLDDIVLVGYSYGGFVVTGTLEHIGDRVGHLVFVDAFVPHDGETVIGLAGGPAPGPIRVGAEWLVHPGPRDYDDPIEAAFADARRSPQPLACFTEPVRLHRPLESFPFTRTYVKATADVPDAPGSTVFWAAADRARQSAAWRYREIATNHMIPNNRPDELVELLLEVAADVRPDRRIAQPAGGETGGAGAIVVVVVRGGRDDRGRRRRDRLGGHRRRGRRGHRGGGRRGRRRVVRVVAVEVAGRRAVLLGLLDVVEHEDLVALVHEVEEHR